MTNEEKLKKQLKATWLALNIISGTANHLCRQLEEEAVDAEFAFTALVDLIKMECLKAQKAEKKIEEVSNDSKAEGNER